MNWTDFLSNLQPETSHQGSILLEKLSSFQTAPDIFWYPGSGRDLVPLLLDVPDNPTRRRLCRVNQEIQEKPFLYWMNDYCESLNDFPEDSLLGQDLVPKYSELWKEYDAAVSVGKNRERYRFEENIIITLFTANVRNREQGIHDREKTGDEYLVCFSSCDSELLLEKIFAPYRFHLSIVALIAQGGFSGQRRDFNQYTDVPDRVAKLEKQIGAVDFWVIDLYGQNDEKMPTARSLREYEYIGGPLPWGWPPARLYGRPDIFYSHEKREYRAGRSWRNI